MYIYIYRERENIYMERENVETGLTPPPMFSLHSLKKGVGMCYVPPKLAKAGTELFAEVRGKQQKILVTKMPFVEQNYYRGPN